MDFPKSTGVLMQQSEQIPESGIIQCWTPALNSALGLFCGIPLTAEILLWEQILSFAHYSSPRIGKKIRGTCQLLLPPQLLLVSTHAIMNVVVNRIWSSVCRTISPWGFSAHGSRYLISHIWTRPYATIVGAALCSRCIPPTR